eukprot:Tbor_TRINITY_DN5337_c3_g4::TRINITY_DN5337_c3_g4_i2::g.4222::m.4222/K00029/E1.1.1.40, maeB; malate dehydrogenase (oxaloacetate-decarboxylating)(NADP+)
MFRCIRPSLISLKGVDFLRNRFTNKGTAFTLAERDHLGVRGLLPPQVENLTQQMDRYWTQFNLLESDINRYQLLRGILDTNVTLYYGLIDRHLNETLPIIYTPTVGEVCQKYGALYQKDHGLYISTGDIGHIRNILESRKSNAVDIIVVTDGSRILGLGDLGANGMGISIGKCSLYVAGAGIQPRRVLPVLLDCGTNNNTLKNDPLYLGQRIHRVDDETFYTLMDEFMEAASKRWPSAVIQFEDFSNNHCFEVLSRYQNKYRCFNDDIQGTGAVIASGVVNAMILSEVKDHRILVFGAGSAAIGVVNSIADLCVAKFGMSRKELIDNVYLMDSKGLVSKNRGDVLQKHKIPFARDDVPDSELPNVKTVMDTVKYCKPTILLGLGGVGRVFNEEMICYMQTYIDTPIIFPLSNPTSKAEVDPADAYKWTNGKAIVASGSPFPQTIINSRICRPSQGNNMYIFPGVGLGVSIAQPDCISDAVFVAASKKLCEIVSLSTIRSEGILYPYLDEIRNVSKHIAVAVIRQIQEEKQAKANLPENIPDLYKLVEDKMWVCEYPPSDLYMNSGKK